MQQNQRDMLTGLLNSTRGLGAFVRDRKAAVGIIAALSLPALIAFSSLVAEYGHGLLIKSEDQRVADAAAYAGALAYNSVGTAAAATSAANAVAALNGVTAANVSAGMVSSPTGDGNQAVRVSVTSSLPLYLASVVGGGTTLPVSASGYAELNVQSTGCIIALTSGGGGVSLSGGTAVTASGCAVASNASETVPCGTTITSKWVTYNSAAPSVGCSGIKGPGGAASSISQKLTTDPLAGASGVTAATSHLTTVTSLAGPAGPTVTAGGAVDFAYNQSATQAQLTADHCSGSFASNTWSVTCTGSASYNFGAITFGGGITVNFNTGGSAATAYNFSGLIDVPGGDTVTFGPGSYNLAGGLMTEGGTSTSFGAGTYNIGKASAKKCSDSVYYSICNMGTLLTFAGPSGFTLQGGVYNNGGSKLVLGSSGTGNSFNIGPASSGNAMWLGGGANTQLGDATDAGSLFQMVGNFWVPSGGGSCTYLGAAAQHDIKGSFLTAGGTVMGAGVYSITGYMDLGGSAGGDVSCNGTTVGMSGTGVTIVLGGSSTPASGTCAGQAFCLAAGYNNVNLTAPTSGTTQGLVIVGPASATGGAAFAEGAANTSLSGALYFPQGAITLSGGASVGGSAGQCLELIGTQVTLSGGTAAASNCVSGGGGTTRIALVQ
ncbi:MAG TPA: hypothetical protein VIJ94_14295 [Caulobacteraceae bacterium]